MKLQGPIAVEIKIYIINEAEGTAGHATFGMPPGEYVSEQQLRDAVDSLEETDIPNGFRLMDKTEFIRAIAKERTGQDMRVAIPGGNNWDA